MGTRSLTVFKNNDGGEIAVLYRQMDGYYDGHGIKLINFLKGKIIVNGIGREREAFNGMSCLAAAVVAYFKTDIGGFYLYPASTRDCGEEYIYTITGNVGEGPTVIMEDIYGKTTTVILDRGKIKKPKE